MTKVQNVIPLCDNEWTITDDLLETMNDYLIEHYCNSKLKKPIKDKKDLFADAIAYTKQKNPDTHLDLIKNTALYLARENKLILINRSDI